MVRHAKMDHARELEDFVLKTQKKDKERNTEREREREKTTNERIRTNQ